MLTMIKRMPIVLCTQEPAFRIVISFLCIPIVKENYLFRKQYATLVLSVKLIAFGFAVFLLATLTASKYENTKEDAIE